MELKLRDFESKILYFNGMYKLPIGGYPTTFKVIENELALRPISASISETVRGKDYIVQRLTGFMKTLKDEIAEGEDIILKTWEGKHYVENVITPVGYEEIDFLTDIADWLGDIIVYCSSEMAKFGIPVMDTLAIIMSSNFSKLQEDGTALYNADGKVMKGPHYFKPEPRLKQMLLEVTYAQMHKSVKKELQENEKSG